MAEPSMALIGLHDIDWRDLRHAYGSAEDVPEQLEALAAGDESVLWDLFGNIYHQGSVYQATAYAVPFLWRILAAHGEVGHSGVASLLGAIGEGACDRSCHWSGKVLDEIWKGAPVALRLLESSNQTARRGAVCAISCLSEKADRLTAPLGAVLRRADCSRHERARVGIALASLGVFNEAAFEPGDVAFFEEAKQLAKLAASGNPETIATCRFLLTETIETDPNDVSDWVDLHRYSDDRALLPTDLSLRITSP